MNGQHTCMARVEVGNDIESPTVVIRYYKATDMVGARALYATMDRGKARIKAHATQALLMGKAVLGGVKTQSLKAVIQGFQILTSTSHSTRRQLTPEAIADSLGGTHLTTAQNVARFLDGLEWGSISHVRRAPVVAAMLATFKSTTTRSKEFWTVVASGVSGTQDDPRIRLRDLLKSSSVRTGQSLGTKQAVNQEYLFRACITAWNLWRLANHANDCSLL